MSISTKTALAGFLTAVAAAMLTASCAHAGEVKLTCTSPTKNVDGTALTDLAGINWLYGPAPDKLGPLVTTPTCDYLAKNLTPGPWYFAATAVKASGEVSIVSSIASKTVAADPIPPVVPPSPKLVWNCPGADGRSLEPWPNCTAPTFVEPRNASVVATNTGSVVQWTAVGKIPATARVWTGDLVWTPQGELSWPLPAAGCKGLCTSETAAYYISASPAYLKYTRGKQIGTFAKSTACYPDRATADGYNRIKNVADVTFSGGKQTIVIARCELR